MPCGRCAERGQAATHMIKAIKAGDSKTAAQQGRFIVTTMAQDAGMAAKIAAAKLRLGRR